MPMTHEQLQLLFTRAVADGLLSDKSTSPVYYKHLMLMSYDGVRPTFKHTETRMYLSEDGSSFYRISDNLTLSLADHHALLAALLTDRARLHGAQSVPVDLRYLIGSPNLRRGAHLLHKHFRQSGPGA